MNTIAIITARGGSKRIPHKNIRSFCGKPIIAYSIQAALDSHVFDRVMVSTDDSEIAQIARDYGAEVPFLRSPDASNDYATTNDVLKEVLASYEEKGLRFDVVGCIYPTAPFLTGPKLQNAMKLLLEGSGDTLMPVVQYSFPPQRAMVICNGHLQYQYPENINKRSQDLEPIYHDCGQFYLFRYESFCQNHSIIGPRVIPLIVDETEVQDIDQFSDWKIAEAKFQIIHQKLHE